MTAIGSIGSIDSGSAVQAVAAEKRFAGIGNRTDATTPAAIAAPNRYPEANGTQAQDILRTLSSSAESTIVTLSAESRNTLSDAQLAETQTSAATEQRLQGADVKAEQAAVTERAAPISSASSTFESQTDAPRNVVENSIKSNVAAAYSGNMSLSQAAQATLSQANQQAQSAQNAEVNPAQTGTQALSQANQQAQSVLRMF